MDAQLRGEIDAMITGRILLYHRRLVAKGQIPDVPNEGPPAILPASDCTQSEHTPRGGQPEGPPLRPAAPAQPTACERECG